jgi:hypothetical protein
MTSFSSPAISTLFSLWTNAEYLNEVQVNPGVYTAYDLFVPGRSRSAKSGYQGRHDGVSHGEWIGRQPQVPLGQAPVHEIRSQNTVNSQAGLSRFKSCDTIKHNGETKFKRRTCEGNREQASVKVEPFFHVT